MQPLVPTLRREIEAIHRSLTGGFIGDDHRPCHEHSGASP
ncbi:hypothetical protein SPHINGO8AM_190128 [Sphingomonas sp. 8AM]|nr:hypothetical protein SPHINGO8AM_190128 [Sphingomonas sp. 8AM]